MYAAVVHSFDAPPRYDTFETPAPRGEHEILVDVLAAGLHPRVRSGASGTHYSSDGVLPMVPGIDAVGRTTDGQLLYFVALDDTVGTMAERAVVDRRRAAPLAPGTDPVAVAAAMNPGMSSWVALRRRIDFRPGANVLILGATGNAGQLAVQIAKHLGAGRVVAAGRDPERLALLPALGADETVSLLGEPNEAAERLAKSAADVDVVIDYLWGGVTESVMPALLVARADRSQALDWIEIGSMAGQDVTLPSALLRKANLRVLGSGQGSAATADIVAELPALAELITTGTLSVHPLPMSLAEVERAWEATAGPGERIVLVP
ncbi:MULTISPECIES: zinc-binding alcohol dehydrogenase family protein [unclassified Streptomyces]|uniref:zinc-binding dehydrogenase n=2 Tax=Streptomyces TaxID=1883 RepID=UPI0013698E0C|nr:zinc-binding dehydrogenase [Streptomyces sp. SID6139]MYR20851.1 zinc-binding dehydrogenase [Streptomyces sp. SID6137]